MQVQYRVYHIVKVNILGKLEKYYLTNSGRFSKNEKSAAVFTKDNVYTNASFHNANFELVYSPHILYKTDKHTITHSELSKNSLLTND